MKVKLIITLLLAVTCALEAKLTFSNLEGEKDFLSALLHELDKLDTEKEDEQPDLKECKEDIRHLRKTLFNIEDESSKKDASNEILQELVKEYNKKMRELEKMYRLIMNKYKNNKKEDKVLPKGSCGTFAMDSLNYGKKRSTIKDKKFRTLELIEVSNSTKTEKSLPLPSEE